MNKEKVKLHMVFSTFEDVKRFVVLNQYLIDMKRIGFDHEIVHKLKCCFVEYNQN
jgi:hypothetical protein